MKKEKSDLEVSDGHGRGTEVERKGKESKATSGKDDKRKRKMDPSSLSTTFTLHI